MDKEKNKQQKDIQPDFTLNTTDKLFFALARRDVDTKSYVYALVINNANKDKSLLPSYSMDIKTEISSFRSVSRADAYYETAKLIMEQQVNGNLGKLHELFRGLFESQIAAFFKMAADFKTKTK